MADLGTVTVSEVTFAHIKKVKFSWLSEDGGDDAGKAAKTTSEAYTGQVIGFACIPSTDAAPTTLYDVTITDEDGRDILHGVGADRPVPITDSGRIHPSLLLGSVVGSTLTLNVSNAGNAKQGDVYLFIG